MRKDPRVQGDIGMAEAIRYYTRTGHVVSIPNTEATRYDLIVDRNGILSRVQCKTSTQNGRYGVFHVGLATNGGNRSGGNIKKQISESEVDEIFIWTSDDRIWCIPSSVVSGMNQINLGKKYAEYEVTSHHVLVETKEQKTSYCKCGNIKKPQSGSCRDCANKNKKLGA